MLQIKGVFIGSCWRLGLEFLWRNFLDRNGCSMTRSVRSARTVNPEDVVLEFEKVFVPNSRLVSNLEGGESLVSMIPFYGHGRGHHHGRSTAHASSLAVARRSA